MKMFTFKKVKPKYERNRRYNRYYISLFNIKIEITYKFLKIKINKLLIEYNGWRE